MQFTLYNYETTPTKDKLNKKSTDMHGFGSPAVSCLSLVHRLFDTANLVAALAQGRSPAVSEICLPLIRLFLLVNAAYSREKISLHVSYVLPFILNFK